MKYKYSKYVPNLLDELDMDQLMSKLSDLLMSSGFGNSRDTDDDSDRTMQALHDAILEALFNGGVLPDDLLEQLFGDAADSATARCAICSAPPDTAAPDATTRAICRPASRPAAPRSSTSSAIR